MNMSLFYALTRQLTQAYAVQQVQDKAIREQRASYIPLLQRLGQASFEEIEPETGLNPNVVEKLQYRISK